MNFENTIVEYLFSCVWEDESIKNITLIGNENNDAIYNIVCSYYNDTKKHFSENKDITLYIKNLSSLSKENIFNKVIIEVKKMAIIDAIKKEIQSMPNIIEIDNDVLMKVIHNKLQEKIQFSKVNDNYLFRYLSRCSFKEREEITNVVFESVRGLDILGKIITDNSITEIMINGPSNIFVEKRGVGVIKLTDRFESQERLQDVILMFVRQAGREVSESNPILDTRLADGSRVNIVLPPIALNGPIVTIRRFPEPITIEKLINYGSITEEVAEFLEKLVKAKYNIFVSGGTGSGKTTFLNALSNYIPSHERVITIEDSAELQITKVPNLVRLETRNSNSAGTKGITIKDLIKSSLRMRPERIVVGEVRGAEALDMLQAMNTGHDGSLSTGHANSTKDMLSRLETMVLSGGDGLPLPAIRQQISSAVDIIIHLSRMRDFSRKTVEITEILDIDTTTGNIKTNPLFQFKEDDKSTVQKVSGSLVRTENPMINTQKFINAGIYDFL